MSTFNELIDFTRSTTGTYLDSVVYGDELVTNGDFSNGTAGWTNFSPSTTAFIETGGQLQITASGGNARVRSALVTLVVGRTYKFAVECTQKDSDGASFVHLGESDAFNSYYVTNLGLNEPAGTYTHEFTAVGTELWIQLGAKTSSNTVSYDNVSVKELTGGQVSGTPLLRTAAINEPRLEYDASGNPLGLLIEEARTNLISTSEELTVASNRAIAESSVSPTGEQTAQTWRVNGSESASPYWYGNPNVVSGTTYTCSVFVRLPTSGPTVESRYVKLTSQTMVQVGTAVFDLQEGTVVSSNMLSESITPVGNGWYRISVTNIAQSSGESFSFILWPIINAAGDLYVISASDDGKALLETFGMQTEAGSFPTSYIPTSGSTVTRNKDVVGVPVERFGYNTSQATVIVYGKSFLPSSSTYLWEIGAGSADRNFAKAYNQQSLYVIANSVNTVNLNAGTFTANNYGKLASALKANSFAASLDGGSAVIDNTGAVQLDLPVIAIGQNRSYEETLNGHIKQIQYYPKRLSNTELQLLTQPSASPTMNLTFDGQATSTLVEGFHD